MTESARWTVAVDGAAGFLGRAVARDLVRRGVRVRALTMRGDPPPPAGVEAAPAPLDEVEPIERALAGVRCVVAARKLACPDTTDGLGFERIHAERVKHLLRAGEAEGVERFVYAGDVGAELRSDDLARAEQLAEAYLVTSKLATLSLQASLVVGPGDCHVSAMNRRAVGAWPVLLFIGQGWARSAPMTVGDFARCVSSATLAEEFPTGVLKVGGPDLLTAMDTQDRLLAYHGRKKLKIHLPESLARLVCRVLSRLMRRPPLDRARLGWILVDRIPDRTASTRLLGRRPEAFERAFRSRAAGGGASGGA